MPKPTVLTPDALAPVTTTPPAATTPRGSARKAAALPSPKPVVPQPVKPVPLQVRLPRAEVRAIKIAAAEREQTISDFMLACFHAYIKK
jgi:hypothetical protein